MQDFTMKIDGMHCNACVNRVTKALEKVEESPSQHRRHRTRPSLLRP